MYSYPPPGSHPRSTWSGPPPQHWSPPQPPYSHYPPQGYPPPNYPPPPNAGPGFSPSPYPPLPSPYGTPYGTPPLPPRPASSDARPYQNSPQPWNHGLGITSHPSPGPPPRPHSNSLNGHAYNINNNNSSPPPRPPTTAQHFGRGAPSNYRFQYSACTGRRKALLIGINYFGQPNQLQGCINDVTNVSTFLHERHGYQRQDMVILTDDQKNPQSVPTKANILRAMQWLVNGAQPNDSLFIHFSGHGGRTPDLDGDEEDGFDDVIYPVDYRTVGHIVDDQMHDIMVRPLQPGVRLTAVFDSCHSGTALDLPYVYSTQGILKEPNLAKEAASDLFSAITSYASGDLGGMAKTAIGFFKKAAIGDSARQRTVRTKTSPADVVMFSGSKDTQTSADTFQDGEARGALSWAFIRVLHQHPNLSYVQLLNLIRAELDGKYSQKPQLSCSHPLDTNLMFVM
ncbi:caspase family protein [Aspergillus stella-maris]|uniref:caspase family protein n=1 Tax=Aspergillus stella-maris TaxID=1810926 RepID=UPI003CCE33F7